MFLRSLSVPVNMISGVGSSFAQKLARLGIRAASDLILHYPRDWEDRTNIVPLKAYKSAKVCTVVTVFAREWIGYGGMRTLKIYIEDENTQAVLVCYNRPWLDKQIVTGQKYMISGTFKIKYGELQSTVFEVEPSSLGASFGKILPIYPLTAGINQSKMRNFISSAINKYVNQLENELPNAIMEKEALLTKTRAVREIHFPTSMDMLEKAKKTLIYEELFYMEVMVVRRAMERKSKIKIEHANDKNQKENISLLQQRLIERLSFSLTAGQINAIEEINRDMSSNIPMARLFVQTTKKKIFRNYNSVL